MAKRLPLRCALILSLIIVAVTIARSQVSGSGVVNQGAVWSTTGTTAPAITNTPAVLYTDTATGNDACAKIFQLMGILPPTGGTIDARGFQGSPGKQACASNPFIVPTNKGQINNVTMGDMTITGVTGANAPSWVDTASASQKGGAVFCGIPAGSFLGIIKSVDTPTQISLIAGAATGCSGGLYTISAKSGQLLLGNTTFSLSFPWIVPSRWRVIGSGRGTASGGTQNGTNTTIRANMGGTGGTSNATFSTCGSGSSPTSTACTSSTVSSSTSTTIVQGTGNTFDWTTAVSVGSLLQLVNGNYQSTITGVTSTTLTVSIPITSSFANATYNITPAMVQFNPTATTFDATNHAIAFGTSISNLQIDCNSFGAGMGIQNWWAQEVSYVRDVGVDNCLGIALDVETTSAMNSGPYADIVSSPGSSAIASTQCVELLNTGDLRGVHGLTCTSTGTPKVGVDVSTQNVTLDDLHLEGFFTGIEVGVYTATNASYVANNVTIVNATGGTGSGGMTTLIDIAGSASSANQVNVFGLGAASSVNGSVTNLINDHITSNTVTTTNDPSLSFYILGLVSGSGRTLLTSSPNVNTNIGNSIQFVPLNGTIQSQSVGQPLTVQAAAGATSSTGGAVSILGGTYNGSTSGQNGGAVSLHGGDITGASASNTNIGGSATVSGGNGTAGNASGGNATLQAGVPASSMGSLGQTIVNQPFFAGASVTAGQVVKFVGNSSVGPTTSGTDTTRMVGFATQTVTSGHVVEVQVAGLVTNATTESNCTRGDWVVLAGTGSPSGTVQCQGNGALASGGTVIGIATQTVNSFPATLSLLIAPR